MNLKTTVVTSVLAIFAVTLAVTLPPLVAYSQNKFFGTPNRGIEGGKGNAQIKMLMDENVARKSETTQNAADIDALEGRMGTAEGDISALEASQTAQDSRIGTLESGLADVEPHAKAPMPGTCHDQNAKLRWNTATSAWECLTEGDPTVLPFAKTNLPTCSASQLLRSNGSGFQCVNAGESYVITESDPKVGAVTSNQWCRGTGSQIACDQPAPTSNDPRITTLSSGKTCTSNGTEISCTTSALVSPPTCSGADKALQWTGGAWNCATLNIVQEESSTCVSGSQVFTSNDNFEAITGCEYRILLVGGGGGGSSAGGGSGRVVTGTLSGISGNITITVGAPGSGGCRWSECPQNSNNGGTSMFGDHLTAAGGQGGYMNDGGDGGSGGGRGDSGGSSTGGTGGTGGSNSSDGSGIGQGTASWNFSMFESANITAGSGGAGGTGANAAGGGGGGGGGVQINGLGPSGATGAQNDTQPGQGGIGYGAGGGGHGHMYTSPAGGAGAPGVVYVEWSSEPSCTFVGQEFQGGKCATTGSEALIAAPTDAPSTLIWGSYGTTRGTTSMTDGYANTQTLVSYGQAAHPAANYCWNMSAGGYTDWYLPANEDLDKLYQSKDLIGGLSTVRYWSSTEDRPQTAWYKNFNDGIWGNGPAHKNDPLSVRCVRKIK